MEPWIGSLTLYFFFPYHSLTQSFIIIVNDIGLDIVIELIQSQLEGYEIHGSAKSVFHYDIEK